MNLSKLAVKYLLVRYGAPGDTKVRKKPVLELL